MNVVASVAERAIWAVDQVLNRTMAYAWMAILQRQKPAGEEDFGSGNLHPPEAVNFGDDDRPLM
jgi:hypothetical protein